MDLLIDRCTPRTRKGSAIVMVTVVLTVLVLLLVAILRFLGSAHGEQIHRSDGLLTLYVAEAGLAQSFLGLERGQDPDPLERARIGSPDDPLTYRDASYWVEPEDLGRRVYALRATATDRAARERIELVVREIPDGFFRYAVFGDLGVSFRPSSFVDSYDSSLGSYESQYEGTHAGDGGNCGSNNDIVLETNCEIYGNANPGPDGEVIHSGPNGFVSGNTDPANELVPLPPVQIPSIPSSGVANVKKKTLVLGPGDVHYSRIEVSSGGTVEIRGPARVVVDDFLLRSNTSLVMKTVGGPVEIYGTGNFVMDANSTLVTHTSRPHDAAIYLSSDNIDGHPKATVTFNANSEYTGLIYAPNANIAIRPGFEIYGSVMAGQVELVTNSEIHYDVSLLFDDDDGPPEYEQVSWRPVALQ